MGSVSLGGGVRQNSVILGLPLVLRLVWGLCLLVYENGGNTMQPFRDFFKEIKFRKMFFYLGRKGMVRKLSDYFREEKPFLRKRSASSLKQNAVEQGTMEEPLNGDAVPTSRKNRSVSVH